MTFPSNMEGMMDDEAPSKPTRSRGEGCDQSDNMLHDEKHVGGLSQA